MKTLLTEKNIHKKAQLPNYLVRQLLCQEVKSLFFLISVNQAYHEHNQAKATINVFENLLSGCRQFIEEQAALAKPEKLMCESMHKAKAPWKITVIIADTLQSYNHMQQQDAQSEATLAQATITSAAIAPILHTQWRNHGENWYREHGIHFKQLEKMTDALNVVVDFVRWQDLLDKHNATFADFFDYLWQQYDENIEFQRAINSKGNAHYNRQCENDKDKIPQSELSQWPLSVNQKRYIIEELALLMGCLPYEQASKNIQQAFLCYPGEEETAFKIGKQLLVTYMRQYRSGVSTELSWLPVKLSSNLEVLLKQEATLGNEVLGTSNDKVNENIHFRRQQAQYVATILYNGSFDYPVPGSLMLKLQGDSPCYFNEPVWDANKHVVRLQVELPLALAHCEPTPKTIEGMMPVKLIALLGGNGTGKSHLANYSSHVSVHGEPLHRFRLWIDASSPKSLSANYFALGQALGITNEAQPTNEKIECICEWLNHSADWLMVFDNAPSFDAIADYLPSQGGTVIVSSAYLLDWPNVFRQIIVGEMSLEQSRQLFLACINNRGFEQDEIEKLVNKTLGNLPMAIIHACAFVLDHPEIRELSVFVELYHSSCQMVFNDKNYKTLTNQKKTLLATWETSLRAIEKWEHQQYANSHVREFLRTYCLLSSANRLGLPMDFASRQQDSHFHDGKTVTTVANCIRILSAKYPGQLDSQRSQLLFRKLCAYAIFTLYREHDHIELHPVFEEVLLASNHESPLPKISVKSSLDSLGQGVLSSLFEMAQLPVDAVDFFTSEFISAFYLLKLFRSELFSTTSILSPSSLFVNLFMSRDAHAPEMLKINLLLIQASVWSMHGNSQVTRWILDKALVALQYAPHEAHLVLGWRAQIDVLLQRDTRTGAPLIDGGITALIKHAEFLLGDNKTLITCFYAMLYLRLLHQDDYQSCRVEILIKIEALADTEATRHLYNRLNHLIFSENDGEDVSAELILLASNELERNPYTPPENSPILGFIRQLRRALQSDNAFIQMPFYLQFSPQASDRGLTYLFEKSGQEWKLFYRQQPKQCARPVAIDMISGLSAYLNQVDNGGEIDDNLVRQLIRPFHEISLLNIYSQIRSAFQEQGQADTFLIDLCEKIHSYNPSCLLLTDENDDTLLHLAAKFQSDAVVNYIIGLYADKLHEALLMRNKNAATPLFGMATNRQVNVTTIARVLAALGEQCSNVLEQTNVIGATILHVAALSHDFDVFDLLLQAVLNANKKYLLTSKSQNGLTVATMAMSNNQFNPKFFERLSSVLGSNDFREMLLNETEEGLEALKTVFLNKECASVILASLYHHLGEAIYQLGYYPINNPRFLSPLAMAPQYIDRPEDYCDLLDIVGDNVEKHLETPTDNGLTMLHVIFGMLQPPVFHRVFSIYQEKLLSVIFRPSSTVANVAFYAATNPSRNTLFSKLINISPLEAKNHLCLLRHPKDNSNILHSLMLLDTEDAEELLAIIYSCLGDDLIPLIVEADSSGTTPLHIACANQRLPIIESLCVLAGEAVTAAQCIDLDNNTLLHYAAQNTADVDVFLFVIQLLGNPAKRLSLHKNNRQYTAIHRAVCNDEFAGTFLIALHQLHPESFFALQKIKTCYGDNIAHLAARNEGQGYTLFVILYQIYGSEFINLLKETDQDGESPLQIAACNKSCGGAIIHFVFTEGICRVADSLQMIKGNSKKNLLHLAAQFQDASGMHLIMQACGYTTQSLLMSVDSNSYTPLLLACRFNHEHGNEVIPLILTALGDAVNTLLAFPTRDGGYTPLHFAAQYQSVTVVEKIIKILGPDYKTLVTVVDEDTYTPLMRATQREDGCKAQMLATLLAPFDSQYNLLAENKLWSQWSISATLFRSAKPHRDPSTLRQMEILTDKIMNIAYPTTYTCAEDEHGHFVFSKRVNRAFYTKHQTEMGQYSSSDEGGEVPHKCQL